jgi:hypothetical protein
VVLEALDGFGGREERLIVTEREMFERSFQRPWDYFKLSEESQWHIDDNLGILDWRGKDLSKEDMERFKNHYKKSK